MDDEGNQNPQQNDAAEGREPLRIEDSEAWFRNNALRENGEPWPTLNEQEDAERFQNLRNYQNSVMETFFADAESEAKHQQKLREEQLETLNDGTIVFHAREGTTQEFPLRPFAESCDAVFALATSSLGYSEAEKKQVECKLLDFALANVDRFSRCVLGRTTVEELDAADSVVDLLVLADYLQNTEIRDITEDILKRSIDTNNCLSICQLADQLGMHSLFELSLQHMMQTLGTIDEGSECWEEMTPDLRERVLVIKSAIQSSVHSQRSKLYFNSLEEYISIFAEKVQYYRERLAEAKDQLHSLPPGSVVWTDTQNKISRQEQRVHTLSMALAEQKKLFNSKHNVVLPKADREREVL